MLETDGSNVIQVVYTLEPIDYGNLISQNRGGTASFYHFDGLGSTDRLTNSSGTVTDSYLYQAFGSQTVLSGSTINPFRFAGRLGYYYDADTAEYYVRSRFYDPVTGRFNSRDPVAQQGSLDPSDSSTYVYSRNNPCSFVDPTGLVPWWGVYGNFCGFFRRGQGGKSPIDTLDYCCQEHDDCCTNAGKFIRAGCSPAICECAKLMRDGGCKTEWWTFRKNWIQLGKCEAAATAMALLFCKVIRR